MTTEGELRRAVQDKGSRMSGFSARPRCTPRDRREVRGGCPRARGVLADLSVSGRPAKPLGASVIEASDAPTGLSVRGPAGPKTARPGQRSDVVVAKSIEAKRDQPSISRASAIDGSRSKDAAVPTSAADKEDIFLVRGAPAQDGGENVFIPSRAIDCMAVPKDMGAPPQTPTSIIHTRRNDIFARFRESFRPHWCPTSAP
jgi:hypothetical protein